MVALFVGGPFDGLSFNHEQINHVAEILPSWSESGHRNFLLMPSPSECTRILRGEITRKDCHDPRHSYEQLRKADGSVEYHDAQGAVGHAFRQQNLPLSEEQVELKKAFADIADRFIERLRAVAMTTDTTVNLVQLFRDRQSSTFRSAPNSIMSKPTLAGFGDSEATERFAAGVMLDTAIGNINSLVRNAPTDFIDYPGHPSGVLQMYDFELVIGKP
jgi:hypothetical protein